MAPLLEYRIKGKGTCEADASIHMHGISLVTVVHACKRRCVQWCKNNADRQNASKSWQVHGLQRGRGSTDLITKDAKYSYCMGQMETRPRKGLHLIFRRNMIVDSNCQGTWKPWV